MPTNFDAIARWYELLERLTFGDALQRCRTALIGDLKEAQRVLILGEGNGRFLEALLKVNSRAEIVVIDSSQRMLDLARRRVRDSARVRFIRGDLLNQPLELPEVDAVVTHFFLDCFARAELIQFVSRLRESLPVGGLWLWSDFAIPENGPMRGIARLVTDFLYDCFQLTTGLSTRRLVDPSPILARAGLVPLRTRTSLGGLLAAASFRAVDPDR